MSFKGFWGLESCKKNILIIVVYLSYRVVVIQSNLLITLKPPITLGLYRCWTKDPWGSMFRTYVKTNLIYWVDYTKKHIQNHNIFRLLVWTLLSCSSCLLITFVIFHIIILSFHFSEVVAFLIYYLSCQLHHYSYHTTNFSYIP